MRGGAEGDFDFPPSPPFFLAFVCVRQPAVEAQDRRRQVVEAQDRVAEPESRRGQWVGVWCGVYCECPLCDHNYRSIEGAYY